ncbi:hypothetical protein E2320_001179 [Naja naja]|nr:hypothetical protein E2320_001179 [Naja naja]
MDRNRLRGEMGLSHGCSFVLSHGTPGSENKSGRVPNRKMNYPQTDREEKGLNEELECKICYQKFTLQSRKPKLLDCLHRVCAKCLTKILQVGSGSLRISCPFCRHETELQEEEVEGLPDDLNILSRLVTRDKSTWNSECKEVLLTPKNLASSSPSRGSSNCLVITIMEVQRDASRTPSQNTLSDYYTDHSLDSESVNSTNQLDQDVFSKLCNHVPRILTCKSRTLTNPEPMFGFVI